MTLAESHAEAVRGAELVISAVTASQTVAAAEACAGSLPAGSFFLDLNSASPGAKMAAAEHVARGAGRYVEGAVMTAVPPHRLKVPLLLGGPDAGAIGPVLEDLGFSAKVASGRLGVASATKMCRSVMIKGLEAMVIESLTAARHHGVEDAVLASLRETFPGIDWEKQAAYFFQRVIEHGRRRGEEMQEAAVTVHEAGLTPWSAAATAYRQSWIAELADAGAVRRAGAVSASPAARTGVWKPTGSSTTWRQRGPRVDGADVREDPRLARLVPEPEQATLHAPDWRSGRALPRVRAGRRVSVRARAQVHPLRRGQDGSCSRCATTSASHAT